MQSMNFTYSIYTLLLIFTVSISKCLTGFSNKHISVKIRDYTKFILIVVYSLVVGLRYNVGRDYYSYLGWFKQYKLSGHYPDVDHEFLYILLSKCLIFVGMHFSWLFIIIAFFQIYFILKALEKIRFITPWYFFFFFTSLLMFSSMNLMRQTIAFTIFFYTISLVSERRFISCAFWLLVAFGFHKSVLLFIWVYPLLHFNWYKYRFVQFSLLFVVTFVVPQVLAQLIEKGISFAGFLGYQYYIENVDEMKVITQDGMTGAGFGKYLFFIIDSLIIFYSEDLRKKYDQNFFSGYYNLYMTGILLERVFASNFILARANDYLGNFRVLILGFLCYFLFNSYENKFIGRLIVFLLSLVMLLYFFRGIDNSAAGCSPFKFFH